MPERPRPGLSPVADMLDLADRTIGACLARVTGPQGLSREQWRTLMLLAEGAAVAGDAPGHSMGEIALRAAVPAPTATRMVDKLVADGLSFRRSDPWDRRRVLVHISSEGHALIESAARELDEAFGTVLSGAAGADRLDLLGLLDRLNAAAGVTERTRTS